MAFNPIFSELNLSHVPQLASIEQLCHLTPWSELTIKNSFGPRSQNSGLFKKDRPFDELVGYCFCDLVAGELSIENICVATTYQNKGYGKILLNYVIAEANKNQVERIFLEVRASNIAALSLYNALKFVECGRRKDYYKIPSTGKREDAVIMKLELH